MNEEPINQNAIYATPAGRLAVKKRQARGIVGLLALLLMACKGPGTAVPLRPELPEERKLVEPLRGPERAVRRAVLSFVGEVRGELDPCGCPTFPLGGFERRKALLDELRQGPDPLFHFDAGELLVRGYSTGGRGDIRKRARVLLDLSSLVGVDAWAPGPTDIIALDPDGLVGALREGGPRPVSATWRDAEQESLFPPFTVVERGGLRVAVVGLSNAPRNQAWEERLSPRDPVEAARAAVVDLPPDLDLVVGLSNLGEDELERVANEVQGFSVILAIRSARLDEPRVIGNTLVVEVPDRGRYLGVLRVWLGTVASSPLELAESSPLSLRTLDRLEAQVSRMQEGVRVEAEVLSRAQASLETTRENLREQARGRNLVYVDNLPLGTSWEGPEEVRARIQAFKDESLAETSRQLAEAAKDRKKNPSYTSSSACVTCHSPQLARWAVTEHARAWESLIKRSKDSDTECVGCHSTGFAVEGGWHELSTVYKRKFKSVQCEACHGPGSLHVEDPAVDMKLPDETLCVGCHDQANSPEFDYKTWLPRATCTPRGQAAPAPQPDPSAPTGSPPVDGQETTTP